MPVKLICLCVAVLFAVSTTALPATQSCTCGGVFSARMLCCAERPKALNCTYDNQKAACVQCPHGVEPGYPWSCKSAPVIDPTAAWLSTGRAVSTDPVVLRLALHQRNLELLEQKFWAVSDPKSEAYGEFMSADDIALLIGADDQVLAQLAAWTASQDCIGSYSVVPMKDYVHLQMPVDCAERLFDVELRKYVSAQSSGRTLIRASAESSITIPAELQSFVASVRGLSDFPHTAGRAQLSRVSGEPGDLMTPTVIAKQYGMQNPAAKHGASLALAEFEDSAFFPSDIQMFLSNFSLPTDNITRIVGFDDTYDGYLAETSLDVQYAMGLAGPDVDAWVWLLGPFDLTAWVLNVTSTPDAPKVHSISYGSPETAFKAPDMARDNTEFQKMGLMGYTILVASGDNGPGKNGLFRCKSFNPNYPASSPYVTAVGGTSLTGTTETGWVSSGGGFSNSFPAPDYQKAAIASYLSTASLPDAALFNKSGRAIPDVSAVATNFRVLMQGFWDNECSGTSASAPVWAAALALVNDKRLGSGKKTLGFVNPALYAAGVAGIGTDITTGENKAGGCKEGFPATEGWDPVTGWGTPNFATLLKTLADDLP